MENVNKIAVEVAYALLDSQVIVPVKVESGMTIAEIIQQLGYPRYLSRNRSGKE